jgi:2-phospho-L-lactate/phosphoenolpyruvate guanylyltransferase
MRTLAVVPIKTLDAAKQRLASALASGARQSLAQAMFSDVVASLRRSRTIDDIAVVTSDVTAEALAHGDHVTILRDDRQAGQSAAALIGIHFALVAGYDRVLLVPGDTPLLDAREVDELLETCATDQLAAAIVPDRHGTGTNALVLTPPDAMEPSFGPGSCERHVRLADQAGAARRVIEVPSLAHDVDTPEDLQAMAATLAGARSLGPRTRGALRQLERSGAIHGDGAVRDSVRV